MPVSTERIENSYRYADGITGGYASELWLVKGVDSMMAISDRAIGLPKVYEPHPINTNLQVRERIIETIIDPQTTIVRIDYRQTTFDIGTIYATSEELIEPIKLSLIWIRDDIPGSNGLTLMKGEGWDIMIYPSVRKYTVNAGGDIDSVMRAIINNKGKRYRLGDWIDNLDFILHDGKARRMKNNQVVAEYSFLTHRGSKSIPISSNRNQAFAVPACPAMGTIYTCLKHAQDGNPYTIVDAPLQYERGDPLPGMPQG